MRIVKSGGFYLLYFNYSPHLITVVKTLPSRQYDPVNKLWKVPVQFHKQIEEFADKYKFVFLEAGARGEEAAMNFADYVIPPMPKLKLELNLKVKPYEFQNDGIAYGLEKKRLIIGDPMGLGKTLQAIGMLEATQAYPALVVCPKSLMINWRKEFEKATDRKVVVLQPKHVGTWHIILKGNQSAMFSDEGLADVIVVNYESVRKYFVTKIDKSPDKKLRLNNITFSPHIEMLKTLIVDESHKVKDAKTQQTKFVKGLSVGKEFVYLITGTPLVNNPRDLVSQLSIINMLPAFGGYKTFISSFCENNANRVALKRLNYLLRTNCFYRREKVDVLKELPSKVRQIVYCDITTHKEYKDAQTDLAQYLKNYKKATDKQVRKSMMGEIMVRIGILKNISARGKLADVIEYVDNVIESGEKLILFTHLREVQQNLKAYFKDALTIFGDNTTEERQAAVERFQSDESAKLIICSIKAAGVGITLTASSKVAFVELPWHPADCDQAEDRAHRIGQVDSVQCIYFLGRKTIDEWIYQVIDFKRSIVKDALGNAEQIEQTVFEDVVNLMTDQV